MEDFVKIFKSKDEIYHITLSEDNRLLSAGTIDALNGITLIGIDLRRLAGNHVTNNNVLFAIEKTIADFFIERKDIMICYYCDFINPIPRTLKNSMPPQEYRSRLFERMFQRYTHLQHLEGVRLSVVEINGINEKYYFHVIYRQEHSVMASIIGDDLKEGFGK